MPDGLWPNVMQVMLPIGPTLHSARDGSDEGSVATSREVSSHFPPSRFPEPDRRPRSSRHCRARTARFRCLQLSDATPGSILGWSVPVLDVFALLPGEDVEGRDCPGAGGDDRLASVGPHRSADDVDLVDGSHVVGVDGDCS
jgi:hypothetical protein